MAFDVGTLEGLDDAQKIHRLRTYIRGLVKGNTIRAPLKANLAKDLLMIEAHCWSPQELLWWIRQTEPTIEKHLAENAVKEEKRRNDRERKYKERTREGRGLA